MGSWRWWHLTNITSRLMRTPTTIWHIGHALRKCMQPVAPKLSCMPWVKGEHRRWPCVSSFSILVCPLAAVQQRHWVLWNAVTLQRWSTWKCARWPSKCGQQPIDFAQWHCRDPGRPSHQAHHDSITFANPLWTACKNLTSFASTSDDHDSGMRNLGDAVL